MSCLTKSRNHTLKLPYEGLDYEPFALKGSYCTVCHNLTITETEFSSKKIEALIFSIRILSTEVISVSTSQSFMGYYYHICVSVLN